MLRLPYRPLVAMTRSGECVYPPPPGMPPRAWRIHQPRPGK